MHMNKTCEPLQEAARLTIELHDYGRRVIIKNGDIEIIDSATLTRPAKHTVINTTRST